MDEYLKTLLEQIRCKKARPYVKKELQDHIEAVSYTHLTLPTT